ncbi:hypothetical protein [cf. Phormidesmis sp. LEGE 11477]|nr:hypothetical protein [cf. Phormidesmis sp. LEGE 11477]MBE9063388.1 hypothetical protein [cf. Phormidesmis sp. LEGE 11477]
MGIVPFILSLLNGAGLLAPVTVDWSVLLIGFGRVVLLGDRAPLFTDRFA